MSWEKSGLGRIFLGPSQDPNLYICIGASTEGLWQIPPYSPLLSSIVDQKAFDSMMSRIGDVMEENAVSKLCGVCTSMCGLCGGLCYGCAKSSQITSALADAVDETTGNGWNAKPTVELVEMTSPQPEVMTSQAFDQYGQAFRRFFKHGGGTELTDARGLSSDAFSDNDRHGGSNGVVKPAWPPLGYNVVVELSSNQYQELSKIWPRFGFVIAPDQMDMAAGLQETRTRGLKKTEEEEDEEEEDGEEDELEPITQPVYGMKGSGLLSIFGGGSEEPEE